MVKLTRAQRVALKRVYDRGPIVVSGNRYMTTTLTYRGFRRRVAPGYGCVMVPWRGMWLGIEPDGYTHS